MLLHQVTSEALEDREEDIEVTWNDHANDIPQGWKEIVKRCIEVDPNKRNLLLGLVKFWEEAEQQMSA
jgi:hypothetical protein